MKIRSLSLTSVSVSAAVLAVAVAHSNTVPDPSCTDSGLVAEFSGGSCVDKSWTTSGGSHFVESEKSSKVLDDDGICEDEGSTTGNRCSPSSEQFLYDYEWWDGVSDCFGEPTLDMVDIPVSYTEATITSCPPITPPGPSD